MKQLISWVCCLLVTGQILYAQTSESELLTIPDTIGYDYYEKTEELLENLDVLEITSGVLYERGFPFVNFEPFKGGALDTVTANRLTFSLAYASLFSMAMDTVKRLPLPQRYMQKVDALAEREQADTIPLLILHQNYHQIFALELDKAHFMRQVGSETIALKILESMEQCGVDSIQ